MYVQIVCNMIQYSVCFASLCNDSAIVFMLQFTMNHQSFEMTISNAKQQNTHSHSTIIQLSLH